MHQILSGDWKREVRPGFQDCLDIWCPVLLKVSADHDTLVHLFVNQIEKGEHTLDSYTVRQP